MIQQLPFKLNLTTNECKRLILKKPWKGNQWLDDDIIDIKEKIRGILIANQKYCAYCGLPFKGKKDKQIEHIAPKAQYRQPQFTFTPLNLVLSCGYCNNLIVKGSKPTVVEPVKRLYKHCEFLIVHPYFDNPDCHFEWTDQGDKILIQKKKNSIKGSNSIDMFDLDSEEMSELRAADSLLEKRKSEKSISVENEILVEKSLDYPYEQ